MDIQEVKRTLCGPMIPVITNLKDDLSVDLEAIKFNVNYVVERGIVKGAASFWQSARAAISRC